MNKKSEVLWFVEAMDDIAGNSKELQFVEYTKEDALEDVKTNRCDFAEYSFKFCKVYPIATIDYLGENDDMFTARFLDKDPYIPIYFKMDFEKYEWKQLSNLEHKQEYYNYLKNSKNLEFPVPQYMKVRYGEDWEKDLQL